MSAIWTSFLESRIYTRIRQGFSSDVLSEYPKLSFTTQEEAISTSKLPVVYIHLLPLVEVGGDIVNTSINAVSATVEVQVYVGTSKYDAEAIAYEVLRVLKGMAFTIGEFPLTIQQGTTIRSILRASRTIGSGDKF